MAANPKRYPRKQSKVGYYNSVCTTCFASAGHSNFECGPIDESKSYICDAFLAERGILTRSEQAGMTAPHRPGANTL